MGGHVALPVAEAPEEDTPEVGESTEPLAVADAEAEVDLPGSDTATPTDSSPVPATAPAVNQLVPDRRSRTARSLCEVGFTAPNSRRAS